MHSLMLEEEDSLGSPAMTQTSWSIDQLSDRSPTRALRIAVVALPFFSNFTDFDSLRAEPAVSLLFCNTPEVVSQADIIILPGTKQTVDDLLWMQGNGLETAVQRHAEKDLVVGICGGMQMLGEMIEDPSGLEYNGSMAGMGLLPIQTIMRTDKVTRNATGKLASSILFGQPIGSASLCGYEIHIGETTYRPDTNYFADLSTMEGAEGRIIASKDGCVSFDTRIFGTYLHGIFDDDGFRHQFICAARAFQKLAPASELHLWKHLREESLNRLALEVSKALDMEELFRWVGLTYGEAFAKNAASQVQKDEAVQ